jgi:hypothetical protein
MVRVAMATNDETRHNVNESHDKIRLETDVTRGTGTRDQEKHKLKVRGETPEEAAEKLDKVVSELKQRGVFAKTRDIGAD